MSTDFSQNLPRGPYALPQTAASLAEQMDIARQVRIAAQVAAKYNIADAALDRIVSLATDDFALGAPSRSMADRISLAVSLAEATNNSRTPFNWISATPQQIEAHRAAMGLLGQHGLHGLTRVASNASGGGGGSSGSNGAPNSESYRAMGAGSSGELNASYNALLHGGDYTKSQLNAAMPFARSMGWTDREGLGILAGAGREFSGHASAYQRALKRGDQAAADREWNKMDQDHDRAKPGSRKRQNIERGMQRLYQEQNDHGAHQTGEQRADQLRQTEQAGDLSRRAGQAAATASHATDQAVTDRYAAFLAKVQKRTPSPQTAEQPQAASKPTADASMSKKPASTPVPT